MRGIREHNMRSKRYGSYGGMEVMGAWRKRMDHNGINLEGGKSYVSGWIRAFLWGDQNGDFDQANKVKLLWKGEIAMGGKCLISMGKKGLILYKSVFWFSKWFQCRFTEAKPLKVKRIRVLIVRAVTWLNVRIQCK